MCSLGLCFFKWMLDRWILSTDEIKTHHYDILGWLNGWRSLFFFLVSRFLESLFSGRSIFFSWFLRSNLVHHDWFTGCLIGLVGPSLIAKVHMTIFWMNNQIMLLTLRYHNTVYLNTKILIRSNLVHQQRPKCHESRLIFEL